MYNPWRKGEILERYYLVSNKNIVTPSNGHKIIIPLKTIINIAGTININQGKVEAIGLYLDLLKNTVHI